MISIIIPAYNSSEYLKRCLDSIVCQPFEDYEVIVVDDGSTDDTGKVLDEYAKRYSRIKAVHKENGGVSTARNAGLDKAQGDYIIFVDCDDYVHEDIVETLMTCISIITSSKTKAASQRASIPDPSLRSARCCWK